MHRYRFDNLVFTPDDGRLSRADGSAAETLRPQAGTLLRYLLDHAGEVVARETLFEVVWGPDTVVDFESGLAAIVRELRRTLEAVGESAELIETVPRRGYRFTGQLRSEQAEPTGSRRFRIWPWAAVAGLLAGTALAFWIGSLDSPDRAPRDYRLAILPFDSYQPVEAMPEHVGLLMADTLLAELLNRPMPGLDLIGRTSLRPYVDRNDVASAVAENLGVELLIEGAINGQADGGWRAEMRLLAVPGGEVIWSRAISGESDTPLRVREVAAELAAALTADWSGVRSRLTADDSTH